MEKTTRRGDLRRRRSGFILPSLSHSSSLPLTTTTTRRYLDSQKKGGSSRVAASPAIFLKGLSHDEGGINRPHSLWGERKSFPVYRGPSYSAKADRLIDQFGRSVGRSVDRGAARRRRRLFHPESNTVRKREERGEGRPQLPLVSASPLLMQHYYWERDSVFVIGGKAKQEQSRLAFRLLSPLASPASKTLPSPYAPQIHPQICLANRDAYHQL